MLKRETYGILLITFIGLVTLTAFFLVKPIPQDLTYHHFSDSSQYWFIPNTLNVLSNIPFVIVGVLGVATFCIQSKPLLIDHRNLAAYITLYLAIALVGVGSGYYHIAPSNQTLVWDRLPMTIAFMALYSVIIGEFISGYLGKRLLIPFLVLGILTVLYWWFSERRGAGDLRAYSIVQFFPMFTIPVILMFFKSRYSSANAYWVLIVTYAGAKLFEYYDKQVHDVLGFVSGHTIKHILSALGLYILILSYQKLPQRAD